MEDLYGGGENKNNFGIIDKIGGPEKDRFREYVWELGSEY